MVEAEEHGEMEGKAWNNWREELEVTNHTGPSTSNFMKLPMEEMKNFGKFPGLESFTLVTCEECGRNVKINAFKSHMDERHSEQSPPNSDLEGLSVEEKERRSRSDLNTNRVGLQKQDERWAIKQGHPSREDYFSGIEKWRRSRVLLIPLKSSNSRKCYRIYS